MHLALIPSVSKRAIEGIRGEPIHPPSVEWDPAYRQAYLCYWAACRDASPGDRIRGALTEGMKPFRKR